MKKEIKKRDIFQYGEDGEITVAVPILAEWTEQELGLLPVHSPVDGPVLYRYDHGCYNLCTKEYLMGMMKDVIAERDILLSRSVRIREALELVYASKDYITPEGLDRDEGVINFQNGMLSLAKYPPVLLSHSPDMRSTIQLPCQWQAEPEPTPVFDQYLQALSGGDQEMALFLLRWIGLCLSNVRGWKVKRTLFMVGQGDAGAQLLRLVERLLGLEHCAGLDLEGLETIPGVRTLYRKRLAGSVAMGANWVRGLKLYQRVVNGDLLDLGKGATFVFNGLLWFCGTEFPEIKEKRDHQAIGQMIILPCCKTPVKDISEDLFRERAGIVSRTVSAFCEVLPEIEEFPEPSKAFGIRERLLGHSSVVLFFQSCMEVRGDRRITANDETTGKVYQAYCNWCRSLTTIPAVTRWRFQEILARYLRSAYKDLVRRQKGNSYFNDYTLTPEARSRFLGKAS